MRPGVMLQNPPSIRFFPSIITKPQENQLSWFILEFNLSAQDFLGRHKWRQLLTHSWQSQQFEHFNYSYSWSFPQNLRSRTLHSIWLSYCGEVVKIIRAYLQYNFDYNSQKYFLRILYAAIPWECQHDTNILHRGTLLFEMSLWETY